MCKETVACPYVANFNICFITHAGTSNFVHLSIRHRLVIFQTTNYIKLEREMNFYQPEILLCLKECPISGPSASFPQLNLLCSSFVRQNHMLTSKCMTKKYMGLVFSNLRLCFTPELIKYVFLHRTMNSFLPLRVSYSGFICTYS